MWTYSSSEVHLLLNKASISSTVLASPICLQALIRDLVRLPPYKTKKNVVLLFPPDYRALSSSLQTIEHCLVPSRP